MGKLKKDDLKEEFSLYPLIAVPDFVLTPTVPQPVKLENPDHIAFLDNNYKSNSEVFIGTSHKDEAGNQEEILRIGFVCIIDRILKMPGAPTLAFIRPLHRASFHGIVYSPSIPMAKTKPIKNLEKPRSFRSNFKTLMERLDSLFESIIRFMQEHERDNAEKLVQEHSANPLLHLYAIAHVSPISWEEKYKIVEANTFNKLLETLIGILDETEQKINIQAAIHERTHQELSKQQKEAFLRTHLKQIKEELGETDDFEDIKVLREKSENINWDDSARKHFEKELGKLSRLNINNPEYSVQYSYLETLLLLPWENYNKITFEIDKVQEILDRDHYGLEKVKERIMEYMAVLKLRNDLKAPIICLYGPPGVGKTSIGKSVAEALGREYSRISLGGVHDESEIRGHRRTYIGSMPGRFIHALSKLNYGNPLILLDEIDKVGKDYKGDPSSALLEALDPEQNNTFHDNFIDHPYDLSKVLFIATANDLSSIPMPLRDRMEIIEMKAYTKEEKREIALRHLVDQALLENGFKPKDLVFSSEAVDTIIKKFTQEAGVRQLKMQISKIIRKLALRKVKGIIIPSEITPEMVNEFLDVKDINNNRLGFRG